MKSKRGSARRKGDEYQDLTALCLALKYYIRHQDYKIFINYERMGNLDDVVIEFRDSVDAYQVKYSINPNEVFTLDDFINPKDPKKRRIYFKKFSDSWIGIKAKYPTRKLNLYLLSNRSFDSKLANVLTSEGFFIEKFVKGNVRLESRKIRQELQKVTGLNEPDFRDFLSCFQFKLGQRSLDELKRYIIADLLDHNLGITNRAIYYEMKDIIEDFAINKPEALKPQILDKFIKKTQNRYLLPQEFEIDLNLYVNRTDLKSKLDNVLEKFDGNYIVITGLPGSGKSTFLTGYFNKREQSTKDAIVRYYCFVDINDGFQKRRVQAQSLRINLLSVLQEKYSSILNRRHDYSEHNFFQVLQTLGKHFSSKNEKLIILIDGLDHAEHMETEIHESIVNALPEMIPKGVLLVVGTQELHKWPLFLKKSRENPNTHIKLPLFTLAQTAEYLIDKCQLKKLSDSQISEIHEKSEGLPLYLACIATYIREDEDRAKNLSSFPLIQDGNIKTYYEMLWQEFETIGRGQARYLCGILSCLRFPVHEKDLFDFQKSISYPDFDDCFRLIKHLLKRHNNLVKLFHNSFREFVMSKLNPSSKANIYSQIANNLKSLEGSDIWFAYAFEYAYRAKDYDYVLDKVNREFVDKALIHFHPDKDIYNAIHWAVECANDKKELLALSHLGALKAKTQERLEDHLNRNILSKTLLSLGKVEDVIKYSYSIFQNQWFIDFNEGLSLLKDLPKYHQQKIGKNLFQIFQRVFRDRKFESNDDIQNYSHCLAIYDKSVAYSLKWLSGIQLKPDILETQQSYIPEYAPHLQAYLDAIVLYRSKKCWQNIKKIRRLYPNKLVRYFLIRSIALRKEKQILRKEVEEYISLFDVQCNPELAFYAALAELPTKQVASLLGNVTPPALNAPEPLFLSDPSLHNYRLMFFALGYENNSGVIKQIGTHLSRKQSWWTSYLLYLLKTGSCVGKHWANKNTDWFKVAFQAIDYLIEIKQEEGERIIELTELCRNELPESIFWITKAIAERYPNDMGRWFEKLKSLQHSKMWTVQYGIMESIEDYTFELRIYERISSISNCKPHVMNLLDMCAIKYRKSLKLKGGSRSEHFLRLSYIASQCGNVKKAEEWLQYGIRSSFIYGYHKDVTLYHLIDILEIYNKHRPESALKRCKDILAMVEWMPYLTDGKETKYLPQTIFERVANIDNTAALCLLRLFAERNARWQMLECLEYLLKNTHDQNVEVLWALSSLFTSIGEYPRSEITAKQHIVKIADNKQRERFEDLKSRYVHFMATNITPRLWQHYTSKYWSPPHVEQEPHEKPKNTMPFQKYMLNQKEIGIDDIKNILRKDFKSFEDTLKQLRSENPHFHESTLTKSVLKYFISNAQNPAEINRIRNYLSNNPELYYSHLMIELGHRLVTFGEVGSGFDCLERVYSDTIAWFDTPSLSSDLKMMAKYDQRRTRNMVLSGCYQMLTQLNGFYVPRTIAIFLEAVNDIANLEILYSGFLNHCQELFTQMPTTTDYDWLIDYSPGSEDFNTNAIDLLVDELNTPEIHLGNKLIDTCRNLSLKVPQIALPTLIERLLNADNLAKLRLLQILYTVAFISPDLVKPYAQKLSCLLDTNHLQYQLLTLRVFKRLQQHGDLPLTCIEKISASEQRYSSKLMTQAIKIIDVQPTQVFFDVYKTKVHKIIRMQIHACCSLLSINESSMIAKIETYFTRDGREIESEIDKLREEWDDYIHPQGWPFVYIIDSFNVRIFNIFNRLLDETLSTSKVTSKQLEAIWYIFQPVDPEFHLAKNKPRPKDISRLVVRNKDIWLAELNKVNHTVSREIMSKQWITLYERRHQSIDSKYEVPYRSIQTIHSHLVTQGMDVTYDILEHQNHCILKLKRFRDVECITLEEARSILGVEHYLPSNDHVLLPIIIYKENQPLFFGYNELVSLPNYLICKYGLSFRDFDLYRNSECQAKYEIWQEGYEQESYSRQTISEGSRLLIHHELLHNILTDHRVELCQSKYERRAYFKDRNKKDPTEVSTEESYTIIHI